MKKILNKYSCIIAALLLTTALVQADYLALKKFNNAPYLVQTTDSGTEVWGFYITIDEEQGITLGANYQYPGGGWLTEQGLSCYPLDLTLDMVVRDSMKDYTGSKDIVAINTNLGVLENWRINRLGEVTLPDTVVEIGDGAFKNCQNMTAINGLSDNLKYIGVSAFEGTAIANDIAFNPTDCVISTNAFLGLKSASLSIGGSNNVILLNGISGAENITELDLSGVVRMEYQEEKTALVEEFYGASFQFNAWEAGEGISAPFGKIYWFPPENRENKYLSFEYMATAPGNYSLTFNRATNPGLPWIHPVFSVSESEVNQWKTFELNVHNTCASNSNMSAEIYVYQESEAASTLTLRNIKFIAPYVEGAAGAIDDGILVMDGEWFERYSYTINEGNGGTIAPLDENAYGAAVTFNEHTNASYPNFQCRFNRVPKTKILRTLVFDIKTSVELPLSFVFPKDYNWSSKTTFYKVIPAADGWQTVYIDLTGTQVENGDLYNQIYIYHRSSDDSIVNYPAVSFEIANPRFEYSKGSEYKLDKQNLDRVAGGGVGNAGIYGANGGVSTVIKQDGSDGSAIGMFEGNEKLETVKLGFNDIPAKAFKDCVNLTTLYLADTVEKVGANAFENTAISGEITLNAIKELDAAAFAGTGISAIKLGPNLVKIGGGEELGAFQDCTALTTIEFAKDSVGAEVGQNAFKGCTSLVELANAPFTSIDRSAFYGSGITNIVITTNVDTIKRKAFFGADNLATVYYVGTAPSTIEEGIFYGFDDLAVTNYVNKDHEAAWAPYTDGGKLTFKSTYTDSDSTAGTTQWMVGWYRYRGTIIILQ